MDYLTIQQTVASYLERDDLTSRIPTFITLAEQEFNRKLEILQMEELAYAPLKSNSYYYDIPSDFLRARNLYIDTANGQKKLVYSTPEQMVLAQSNRDSSSSPEKYTITDGKFKLDTLFDDTLGHNLYIAYIKRFAPLVNVTDTNWVSLNAVGLYIYGSILAAEVFLYNDERMPIIRSEFQRIIDELNVSAEEGRYSGDSLRIRAT